MTQYPTHYFYTKTHEWVHLVDSDIAIVGITDYAAHQMGELVYVELPETNQHLNAGNEAGVVESVKTAADFYVPLAGTVLEVNTELNASPETVNHAPHSEGWLFKLKLDDAQQVKNLLDADAYKQLIAEEDK